MPETTLMIIAGAGAATILLVAGVVLAMWMRRRSAHGAQDTMQHVLAEALGQLQVRIQEQVGQSSDNMAGRVQEALQASRIEQSQVLHRTVQALEGRFANLQSEVDRKLGLTVESNRRDLDRVADRLAHLNEATGKIVSLSKGVHDLHTLLRAPSGRGNFGEWTLERMLEELLGCEGQLYRRQYTLQDGQRVDVAIMTQPRGLQVLCVDAKFPAAQAAALLDRPREGQDLNAARREFRKSVQRHAEDIASRYIRPPETQDFAFMFVPSEAIFQLLLRQPKLHARLLAMRVVPTAPNSFYAYLQVLSFALRNVQVQERAVEIQKHVHGLGRDLGTLSRSFGTLGTHLRNAGSKYEEARADLQHLEDRLASLHAPAGAEEADAQDAEPLNGPETLSTRLADSADHVDRKAAG